MKNLTLKNFEEVKKNYKKTVQLFLTEKCNLNCGFCFRREKGFEIEDMSFEIAKNIISKYSSSETKISFTGGEPTLNRDLEKMLESCSDFGIESEIYTNGKKHFNNYDTEVKLRYDGFDQGSKPMSVKVYHGSYQLGLLIDGKNTSQLIKCLSKTKGDKSFEGIIQITEVIGKNHLPVCGTDNYSKEAKIISNYVSENCDWINKIEISVGALGIDAGSPDCRFERYFGSRLMGACPHDLTLSECKSCFFQKKVYKRMGENEKDE